MTHTCKCHFTYFFADIMPDSSAISTFHRWAWMESIERNMANLRAGIRIQKKALIGAQKIKSKQKCFQLPNRPPLQVKVRKINSAKKSDCRQATLT